MTTPPLTSDPTPPETPNNNNNPETPPPLSALPLYNLSRAHAHLASLASKPHWTNADTSSFDCLHYNGHTALDHCASKLNLQPRQRVLDVGSGFSATGRFLADKYGVWVTGVEVQRESHEIAKWITRRNEDGGVVERVRSVCADFLSLRDEWSVGDDGGDGGGDGEVSTIARFDHVVSLLCIMHIPESARLDFFSQAARFLEPGGRMYVEEFYDRSCEGDAGSLLTEGERRRLREVVACPYIPSASRFVADVAAAGFEILEFEDVSEEWTRFVRARAEKYRASETPNAELQEFYDTVAGLFEGGNVGGVRLTAVRG